MSVTPRPDSGGASAQKIIPPIITNEKDRLFLINLNADIDQELSEIDNSNLEQRYIVYKGAFDKLIDYVTTYKPLLTAVKSEYEDCIEAIQRGQREAFFLAGKLKGMASEPSTIHNYRRRADDLERKLAIIAADNDKRRERVEALRGARLQRELKTRELDEPPKKEVKRDRRPIPGLTLPQSTDMKVLTRELDKLERQIKELSLSHRTRFSAKVIKDDLKDQLADKVVLRDQLTEQTEQLKYKRHKLKISVEAAQAYLKIQPPHQTIGDAVCAALNRASSQLVTDRGTGEDGVTRGTPSTSFDEDDPCREKEAEQLLEYIEKFNEMIEDEKYEAAAIHAANSPKGILRTPETIHRFKELNGTVVSGGGRGPLLVFCEVLMATVHVYGVRPSGYMSLQCAKCALEENRLDLLSHWVSQNKLTATDELGALINQAGQEKPQSQKHCLAMAQKIYIETESHVAALVCMIRQGRMGQAMQYAQKLHLVHDQYVDVLRQRPSEQLAAAFFNTRRTSGKSLLPLGVICYCLLNTPHCKVGLQLIEVIRQGSLTSEEDYQHASTPLRKAIFDDDVTTELQWHAVVQQCQHAGYEDAGVEVLATVTVLISVRKAMCHMAEMQRQKEEEEKRRLQEEETLKAEKKKKKRRKKRHRYGSGSGKDEMSVEDKAPVVKPKTDGNETDEKSEGDKIDVP